MRSVDLEIGGMTCASCAARIDKRLNKLEGVDASVNYATERAHVSVADGVSLDEVIGQVEAIGYRTTLPEELAEGSRPAVAPEGDDPELLALRQRLIGSAVLGLPVLLLSMTSSCAPGRRWQPTGPWRRARRPSMPRCSPASPSRSR